MSSDIAIKVENLSKCYQIYDTPRDRLRQMILPRLQRAVGAPSKQYFREFWALKDVSFEVKRGETVGIIGRNGSGKSTLLQMICGTLSPSSGNIQTHGRVAALLELGSGFNPEFTGRENVYMNASVLGLSKEEVDTRFDEIASFAEIGKFIEQPVKTYSSGMAVRLAFAVAISVDPDILIVDEALSVGDELFQRKCFSRIETIRSAGATILFVSHSGGTVVELCDRALLLDCGERLAMGVPKSIVGIYHKFLYAPQDRLEGIRKQIRCEFGDTPFELFNTDQPDCVTSVASNEPKAQQNKEKESTESFDPSLVPESTITYESLGAVISNPAIYNLDGQLVNNLNRGKSYFYRYRVLFNSSATGVRFGMLIKTTSGIELGGAVSASSSRTSLPFVSKGSSFTVEFKFTCRLNAGVYFLNAGLVGDLNGTEKYLHRIIDVAMFRVMSETDNLVSGTVDFSCTPIVKIIGCDDN